MSAMRAEELPELPDWLEPPAAVPPDSAQRRAATRWAAPQALTAPAQAPTAPAQAPTAPAQAPTAPIQTPAAPVPVQTPRYDPPGKQAIHPARTARGQAANPPLRLTRRGRIVVAVAVALVLAALSLVIAGAAQATNHPASARAAQQNLAQVTVHPGQSLWSVAESADPNADTRVVIQQIIELNSLAGNTVFAGQRLWVPRG
jgi:LysM domain